MIKVYYTIICKNDLHTEINIKDILSNEKIVKIIKSEFASGIRNLILTHQEEHNIIIKTKKEKFDFLVEKNDFADLVELAEEDAKKYKRLKKECDGIELIDIITVD